jgi:hypothetical protein
VTPVSGCRQTVVKGFSCDMGSANVFLYFAGL